MDRLRKLNKELAELGSEINLERKKVLSLLDDETKSTIESACTELKSLQSKNNELDKRFLVSVNVFVAQKKAEKEKTSEKTNKEACGLCGKTKKLTKSVCCNKWICDDADKYVMCSFAKTSCFRNHNNYTLCNYHVTNSHSGKWQDCEKCKKNFEPEMYAWYATNNYNFEKMDTPKIAMKCANCGFVSYEVEDFGCSMSGATGCAETTIRYCSKEKCVNAFMTLVQVKHGKSQAFRFDF